MQVSPAIVSNRLPSPHSRYAKQLGLSDRMDLDQTRFVFRRYEVDVNLADIPKNEFDLLVMQDNPPLAAFAWHIHPPKILLTKGYSEEAFFNSMPGKLLGIKKKTAVVFLHGFNINPVGMLTRMSKFQGILNDPDVDLIGFDWACMGGLFANYAAQHSRAVCSAVDFKTLLKMLSHYYDNVIIVAHSMGCDITLMAVTDLYLEGELTNFIKRMLHVDADVSRMEFKKRHYKAAVEMVAEKEITVLMSKIDWAIKISSWLRFEKDPEGDWHDRLRLGSTDEPIKLAGVKYRDCTALDDPPGHDMSIGYAAAWLKGTDRIDDPRFYDRDPERDDLVRLKRAKKGW
jgi:hypothetical protein